ncbi:hypothetical protein BDB00DRAFT_340920 [Zychaea mexicana]|uniref:uncharacterized protein n=1 Tax=Zychaea mexicana TaxID=64656 RepID=UPI0022FEE203|nr:uncharacterized protein BDB00DRAFT_340920 [Zychaea mexicana]KAI9494006.1 hypothetical protein BDB00DRAFT_340920 [Zychaea mexicana]
MSSLAALISSVKSNTANNTQLQRTLGKKRSASNESSQDQLIKKLKKEKAAQPIKTKKSSKADGPDVVVFDDSALSKQTISDRADRKAFMSSKISKAETLSNGKEPKKMTEKEQQDEEENKQRDFELNQLLATSKLLEDYQKDEMTGKERRKHMMDKLENLGVKKSGNPNMPLAMHKGMQEKKREREQKRMQEAMNMGLYDKSLKHLYTSSTSKKKERNRDPGITNGIGRMKGGTLIIGKQDIARVQRQGTKSSSNKKKR